MNRQIRVLLLGTMILALLPLTNGCTGGPVGALVGALVCGIVRDALTNKPIAGVTVNVGDTQVVTDENGYYAVSNLPTGTYTFHFALHSFSYRAVDVSVNVTGALNNMSITLVPNTVPPPTNISLTLPPPGIHVGQVAQFQGTAESEGKPLNVFWTVQPSTPSSALIGYITADGRFIATTTGEGYIQAQIGQTAGGIYGVVTRNDGAPVAGATVIIAAHTTFSDSDGTFILPELAPDTYTVTATSGSLHQSVTTTVQVNSVTTLRLTVQ